MQSVNASRKLKNRLLAVTMISLCVAVVGLALAPASVSRRQLLLQSAPAPCLSCSSLVPGLRFVE